MIPLSSVQQSPQSPEGDTPPQCVICLQPLWFTVEDSTIPIQDERLLFFPSLCTRPHGLHFLCAKTHAKMCTMERKSNLACPICRTAYGKVDRERLLPAERRLDLELLVQPIEEDSVFDIVLWERYDPSVSFPRNPAFRHSRVEQLISQRYSCSDLPLAHPIVTQKPPNTVPPSLPLLETPTRSSPPVLLQRRPLREESVQQHSTPLLQRLLEETSLPQPPNPVSPNPPRTTAPPSAFQQTLEGSEGLSRALNCLDEGVQRLRLLHRARRRLDFDEFPTSHRVTRSATAEVRRHDQTMTVVTRMGEKLRTARECLNGLERDLDEYVSQQRDESHFLFT